MLSTINPSIVTLGEICIDDITYGDGTASIEVLGGSGCHFAFGARPFFPPPFSQQVGIVANLGFNFPQILYNKIANTGITVEKHWHHDKFSPRGWNIFHADDLREFDFSHDNIVASSSDIPEEWFSSVKVVHFLSAETTMEIVNDWKGITRYRAIEDEGQGEVALLWEPAPHFSKPENWESIKEVMKEVTIVTPNHQEAATLLGRNIKEIEEEGMEGLSWLADQFLDAGIGPTGEGCVVIRGGKKGCIVASRKERHWIPAYWVAQEGQSNHPNVRDVTGAGNSFCGGFAAGWVEQDGDLLEAGLYGTVSASFTVEHIGTPRLFVGEDGSEKWNNGPSPRERLEELRERVKKQSIGFGVGKM